MKKLRLLFVWILLLKLSSWLSIRLPLQLAGSIWLLLLCFFSIPINRSHESLLRCLTAILFQRQAKFKCLPEFGRADTYLLGFLVHTQ